MFNYIQNLKLLYIIVKKENLEDVLARKIHKTYYPKYPKSLYKLTRMNSISSHLLHDVEDIIKS